MPSERVVLRWYDMIDVSLRRMALQGVLLSASGANASYGLRKIDIMELRVEQEIMAMNQT